MSKELVRKDTYGFFSEEVSTAEDQDWKEGSYTVEAKNIEGTNESLLSVKYKGVMQTFGDVNYNHRKYEGDNVYQAFMSDPHAQKKYRNNKLNGELGHPLAVMENENLSFARLCEVPKERSAIIIRNLQLNGDRMTADIQTDPGTQDFGVNIAKSIIGAGYVPSHSLRSFGVLRPGTATHDCKGIVDVKKFITYDCVESPSHVNADAIFGAHINGMKGSVKKHFEGVEQDPFGRDMIPFSDLAYYAMQESKQEYLMEAFKLDRSDLFGVTESGNSVVLRQRDDIFYVPVTEDVHREIKDVLKSSMRLF